MRPRALAGILVCALSGPGCGDDVSRTGPAVFVERWDPESGCFAACPEQGALPEGLDLGGRCATAAPACGLAGGEDSIRVTVDLGDVEVARRTDLPPPRLDFVLDSEVVNQPGALPPRAPGKERASYSGVLDVPARGAESFAVRVDFGEGFGGESAALSVAPPVVEIAAPGCDSADCSVEAGSGRLLVRLSASRGLPDKAVVLSDAGDGPVESEVSLSTVVGRRRTGSAKVAIPWVENGQWTLQAIAGDATSGLLVLVLAPLSLEVELAGCTGPAMNDCALPGGATTTLVVSAPKDALATSATVSTKVDGLLGSATFTVDLDTVEGDRRSGAAKIEVVNQPGATFQVLARLGESVRASPVVHVASTP